MQPIVIVFILICALCVLLSIGGAVGYSIWGTKNDVVVTTPITTPPVTTPPVTTPVVTTPTVAPYVRGTVPATPTWTKFLSNDPAYDIGAAQTQALFDKTWIIRKDCPGCNEGYKTTYYKRLTPFPSGVNVYDLHTNWRSIGNILNKDFELYPTLGDLRAGTGRYETCNYDDATNTIGAYRDCGLKGSVGNQWFSPTPNKGQKATFSIMNQPDLPTPEVVSLVIPVQTTILYVRGTVPAAPSWTPVVSNQTTPPLNIGTEQMQALFNKTWVMRRECVDCSDSHRTVFYKRLTEMPSGLTLYDIITRWGSSSNLLNKDFELYGSLDDLRAGKNRWLYSNYLDQSTDGVGSFRDAGPTAYTPWQWYAIDGPLVSKSKKVTYAILDLPK